jgi:hypothetical protein
MYTFDDGLVDAMIAFGVGILVYATLLWAGVF